MPTTLRPTTPEDRTVLERLWQLYRHDLSEFRDSHPDEQGLFKPGRLPQYFVDDPDRAAYVVEHDGALAGFVLLRGLSGPPLSIAEFFVLRSLRRHGVGYAAAGLLLDAHPGAWQIAFQDENPNAARLWRRFVRARVGDDHVEERRPVPDKPHLPHDVFLLFTTT